MASIRNAVPAPCKAARQRISKTSFEVEYRTTISQSGPLARTGKAKRRSREKLGQTGKPEPRESSPPLPP